nr:MAG TPA: hypothetical protein [Caudoviricetes sp.]
MVIMMILLFITLTAYFNLEMDILYSLILAGIVCGAIDKAFEEVEQ